MECKLISRYSPLLVLFLATLVNAQTGRKRDVNNLYQVIYYGDSQIEVGKPFSIACIISIADPVEWHKDGEPIRKHGNIRHGKDEHSYIENEMGLAGNRDKIEATISVQRALPKHQGRYQCNSLYKNYHMLYVHRNGTSGSGGGAGGTSREKTSGRKPTDSESVVGPLLLSTIKPTLITSITASHLSTPGSLVPALDLDHTIALETEHSSQHHHHQQQPHHHQHQLPTSGKTDDQKSDRVTHTFKPDSVRFMNKNQDKGGAKESSKGSTDEEDPERYDEDDAEDEYSDSLKGASGKDNAEEVIIIGSEDGDGPSGAYVPLEDLGQGIGLDTDDDEDPSTSIVIESKDVSLEDSIDKLIQNKSEINGVIRVESSEEIRAPPRRPQQPPRKSDQIRDENMLIAPAVVPSSATTALMILPTTKLSLPTSFTTTMSPAKPPTVASRATTSHDSTAGGHHHHHHRESAVVASSEQQQRTAAPPVLVVVPEVLIPNFDDPSTSLKYFDIGKALTLGCNVTIAGTHELSWSKDGVNVSDIESLKDRYRIIKEENKFIISRALDSDAGSYACSIRAQNASRSFNVVANVVVKFQSTEIGKTNMVEGDALKLHCVAYGTNPHLTWVVGNHTLSSGTDHINLEKDDKGVENAILIISSVTMADYTDYTCRAENSATSFTGKPAEVTITVRIRGKYAALYVFLGIIAEVVVLCLIILICEKRRNKTEIEESDTDQSPDQRRRKSSRNYN
ncbi:uncharacterized protein LOC129740941 isoform X2 [Uranotaenia lowii]|uniref:uncharacterized protein LOC129740941 isoform X2 n=1 Tax=Uranotaenia lowii TaxID=190385 RepID=UPI00247A1CCE|nr:uncharacterized protein LOC129740941 isoform X2 [Uranotaenia lowii]